MRLPKWLLCAGVVCVCVTCRADVIDYNYNGSTCSPFPGPPSCTPVTFEFQISSTAIPEISVPSYFGLPPYFVFGADQVTFVSSPEFGAGDVVFIGDYFVFEATLEPDYFYGGVSFTPLSSAPLYSGSVTNPTLLTGDFGPTRGQVDSADESIGGTLVVTDISSPAATPEPSSLLLLGTGVLGVVGVARRRWTGGA